MVIFDDHILNFAELAIEVLNIFLAEREAAPKRDSNYANVMPVGPADVSDDSI